MKAGTIIGAAVGLVLLATVAAVALHNQRQLMVGLPPRFVCATTDDAYVAAEKYRHEHGGWIASVQGTGSMAPYIPAARKGENPTTLVAYVVITKDYDSIAVGALVLYTRDDFDLTIIHQAAELTSTGWVMTGLHNRSYESNKRVTRSNYVGTVTATFTLE